jgi:hypothetical protein
VKDLAWTQIVIQNVWYEGWTGEPDQTVTRLDSDDAIHELWFKALDDAPKAEIYCTRAFLRLDIRSGKTYSYRRDHPSPLAAFRRGKNPLVCNHADLEKRYGGKVHLLKEPYLLQVAHQGNLSTRWPKRFRRRVPKAELRPFAIHESPPYSILERMLATLRGDPQI